MAMACQLACQFGTEPCIIPACCRVVALTAVHTRLPLCGFTFDTGGRWGPEPAVFLRLLAQARAVSPAGAASSPALPWPASSLLEFPLHKVALAAGQPAAREVLQDRMCGEVTSRHMNVALCGFVVLRVPIGHPAFIQAWADERLMEEKRLLHETLAPRTPRRPSTFCAPIAGYAAACGSTSAAFPAIAQLIWTSMEMEVWIARI